MPDTAAVNLTHQTLFRSEYELELEDWLRRRFRSVGICYFILAAFLMVLRAFIIGASNQGEGRVAAVVVTGAAGFASLGAIGHFLWRRGWGHATRPEILRGASTLILILGGISLAKAVVIEQFRPEPEYFLLPLFFWHFIACLFLPWTPRESLRAILPLMIIWALGVLFLQSGDLLPRFLKVIFGPTILLPGLLLSSLRLRYHGESFRTRMIGKHFLTMRQEFMQARSIHESMFPKPHDDGFVRFDYTYTPMRELGGDYVHLHVGAEGLVHLTLLDVTGHGLAAALTVNRLYGELERIRAESPLADPGDVLSLLNRYINLTMSRHTIFVTAFCITIDPYLGKLHWANAGHPPGYLRGANGAVTTLPATTVLLGALDAAEFTPEQKTMELSPGDIIVLYTDGAFEARDRLGKLLGLPRLDQMMHTQPSPGHWPQFISAAVEKHAAGRTEDDILIAAITFKAFRPEPAHTKRVPAKT